MASEQGAAGVLVAAALEYLRSGSGKTEPASQTGDGDEVPLGPRHHPGQHMPLGERAPGPTQRRLIGGVGDLVVEEELLLPGRLGTGDQDDVVVGGDTLQTGAAIRLGLHVGGGHDQDDGARRQQWLQTVRWGRRVAAGRRGQGLRRRTSKADAHWGSSINLRAYRAVKELFSPRSPAGSCQRRPSNNASSPTRGAGDDPVGRQTFQGAVDVGVRGVEGQEAVGQRRARPLATTVGLPAGRKGRQGRGTWAWRRSPRGDQGVTWRIRRRRCAGQRWCAAGRRRRRGPGPAVRRRR